MERIFTAETWREFLEKFSSYEGSLSGFCKENNISKSQFYYYKKRFGESTKPTFRAISLNKKEPAAKNQNSIRNTPQNIRIEIGKANIYIPATETAVLKDILKELAASC
jgi:hypothetical protein